MKQATDENDFTSNFCIMVFFTGLSMQSHDNLSTSIQDSELKLLPCKDRQLGKLLVKILCIVFYLLIDFYAPEPPLSVFMVRFKLSAVLGMASVCGIQSKTAVVRMWM